MASRGRNAEFFEVLGNGAHRGGVDFIFPSGNRWRSIVDRSRIGTPILA
jgi:hypothetical protein